MFKALIAAAAAAVLAAGAAQAQPAEGAPSASTPAPSARALELSRRLMTAVHIDQTMAGMMKAMVPQMVDMQAKRIPGFRPEWRQPLIEAQEEAMADLGPELIKRMEPIYARSFTEEELTQAVAFYESPVGQSMISKMPALSTEAIKALRFQDLMQQVADDARTRFCKKIGGCDTLDQPAVKP